MDISNLNCPQYVCFEKEIFNNNSMPGLEDSSLSIKDDMSSSMEVEDVNSVSYYNPEQTCRNMVSPLSESHLTTSICEDSPGSSSVQFAIEDFPVVHNKKSLPSENGEKKYSKGNKTTRTVPFRLTEAKKRKNEDDHVPLAEQVAAFQRKTPQRFHTTGSKVFQPTEHWSPHIVHPKSPNLQAVKRVRGVHVLSREQLEEKEVEEMKRYRFRAQPVNHNILQRPHGSKISKKPATRPRGMQLRTAQRAIETYSKSTEEEKPYEFHARPVPKAILSGPTGIKEKQNLPVTEAKTPNFALKIRAEKWKSENKLNETVAEMQTFKALPAPVPAQPFLVKHDKKRTEIKPFSFDNRDKERMAQKEQKIMEEIEKENKIFLFKAQLLPDLAPSVLPAVSKKPATRPQPFNFHLDEKNSRHSSFDSSPIIQCSTFKANPATVLKKPPFIPEKSGKSTVDIKEFKLHTDVRASERLKLKKLNVIKEEEFELARQRMKEMEEEAERKEIAKLRKEIVHRANPIRHYKPVEIKHGLIPPTEPVSPKFKTEERLKTKH